MEWHTVKEFEQQYMHEQLRRAGTPGPKVIGIDEVSIRKGHTCRIVLNDLLRGRSIWFGGADRSEASMDEFFTGLGANKNAGIRLAVMDMWKPFSTSTTTHTPQASILFDRVHVLRHLGDALDTVQESEFHSHLTRRDERLRQQRDRICAPLKDRTSKLETYDDHGPFAFQEGSFMIGRFLQDTCYKIDFDLVTLGSDLYFVPAYASHRPACTAIKNGQYYEPMTHALIGLLMQKRPGNMVHAGTFYGDMLPSFSKKCPGTVYAFEPVLENYVLAKLCVSRNSLSNVALFNSALGDRIGTAFIEFEDIRGIHKGGGSNIGSTGQATTIVTIDSLAIDNPSVLQLDVEGFELHALKGAQATITKSRPTILVEDNDKNCSAFLGDSGYALVGGIPGLNIWSHHDHKQALKELLVQSRDQLATPTK